MTDSPLLRLLDANANRAREGLRVAEDVARFALEDARLAGSLRDARHGVTAAVASLPLAAADLLAARDIASDVGAAAAAAPHGDLAALARSNLHRAQEALRVLEESARALSPAAAASFAAIRFEVYAAEQALGAAFAASGADGVPPERTARARRFREARLYVITDAQSQRGRTEVDVVAAALSGGADVIQLRAKTGNRREILAAARAIRGLCTRHGALFVVNDRPGIAVLSDADGLHVGQDDLAVSDVRSVIGLGRLVGVSTHSLAQAEAAESDGADYLGVGPVFETPTKPEAKPVGLSCVRAVAARVRIPQVAIGGLDSVRAAEAVASGAERIAVVRAAVSADDVAEACRRLRAAVVSALSARPASLGTPV